MFNESRLSAFGANFDNSQGDPALIPIDEISHRPNQVRQEFNQESLHELAENIRQIGILQPVLVRPTDNGYELIAGERRLRAAIIAELKLIPALIREMTDEEVRQAEFFENVHRENLTNIEESQRVKADIERLGSREAAAKYYNKSLAWVCKKVSLLDLPEQTTRLIEEDLTADTSAILIVKQIEEVAPERAKELVEQIAAGEVKNVRLAAEFVKADVKPTKSQKAKAEAKKNDLDTTRTDTPEIDTKTLDWVADIVEKKPATGRVGSKPHIMKCISDANGLCDSDGNSIFVKNPYTSEYGQLCDKHATEYNSNFPIFKQTDAPAAKTDTGEMFAFGNAGEFVTAQALVELQGDKAKLKIKAFQDFAKTIKELSSDFEKSGEELLSEFSEYYNINHENK